MRSREEIRAERRRYEADVSYDVWRGGGNPDRVNPERVEEAYYNGLTEEGAARQELQRQRSPEPEPEPENQES